MFSQLRLRTKILLGIGLVLIFLMAWSSWEHRQAKARARVFRERLIAQGEKLSANDIDPPQPQNKSGPEFLKVVARLPESGFRHPSAMRLLSPGVARVVWKEKEPYDHGLNSEDEPKTNYWQFYSAVVNSNRAVLQEIQSRIHSGKFHFDVGYEMGLEIFPMEHLTQLKQAALWLSMASLSDLHGGRLHEAFASIHAGALLSRSYEAEPLMISQLVRTACAHVAYNATWEALHFDDWTDEQLTMLQQAWEGLDFAGKTELSFAGERIWGLSQFPEGRKTHPMNFFREDPESRSNFSELMDYSRDIFSDPKGTLNGLMHRYPAYWIWIRWWSYDDEIRLCQMMQVAIDAARMFQREKNVGPALEHLKKAKGQFAVAGNPRYLMSANYDSGQSMFLLRIALMQTQAEMMATAIAAKRYRLRHQKYPAQLSDLVPSFLSNLPIDYYSGQPLHYRLQDDGEFLLYSVGENLKDDGGVAMGAPKKTLDLVWLRPATTEEMAAHMERESRNRRTPLDVTVIE